jgi:uncharacterized membrane protein YeiB
LNGSKSCPPRFLPSTPLAYFFLACGSGAPAIGLVLTVILYSAQVVASNWWLRRYRFGPMEWLWRGLTYTKFPHMRKTEPAPMLEPQSLA